MKNKDIYSEEIHFLHLTSNVNALNISISCPLKATHSHVKAVFAIQFAWVALFFPQKDSK